MGGLEIVLGDGQVTFAHIQGGVAQGALEGVDVGVVAEVVDGKSVPKGVGGVLGEACALTDALDDMADASGRERAAVLGGKERLADIIVFAVQGEVAPDYLARPGRKGHDPVHPHVRGEN